MTATIVLAGLALGTYGLKSAAPLLLGSRSLPPAVARAAALLPAALLAALVLASTFARDTALVIDARVAGLIAAGTALALRAPFAVAVVTAAAATAMARLVA